MTTIALGDAPEVRAFYGRTAEVQALTAALIDDDRRMIIVQGSGGMGKTRLSLGALQSRDNRGGLQPEIRTEILNRFDHIVWISLLNAPILPELARRLVQSIPPERTVPASGQDVDPVERLLASACAARCLFVVDNLESLLDAGNGAPFRSGYGDYARFLERFVALRHESCVLLTSREVPETLGRLCGPREPGLLFRTPDLDPDACARILTDHGIAVTPELVARITGAFGANPLSIDLVARRAQAVYDGDVSRLVDAREMTFGEMRELLEWHFGRLTRSELDVAYCLAVAREALDVGEIAEDLRIARTSAGDAVAALDLKFPLERRGVRVTMHPAAMECATERLVADVVRDATNGSIDSLDRLALYRVASKEFIRSAQERLVLAPVVDGIGRASDPQHGINPVLRGLVCTARRSSGFAGGNLLNLMWAAGLDLRGEDFSGLTVRGAHLPHVRLADADFSGSTFVRCVFATTLGSVLSIATTPDGLAVVTGDNNGDVRSWRISDGAELLRFEGHREWVRTIAYSPDGRTLITGGSDCEIRVWDASTGRCLHVLHGHAEQVYSVHFHPGGGWLASGAEDGSVILWDVAGAYRHIRSRSFPGRVRSVRFDPTGEILAVACDNLQLWRFGEDGEPHSLDLEGDHVRRAIFDPAGRNLAYVTGSGCLCVADARTLATLHLGTPSKRANWVEFSPDGTVLAAAYADGKVGQWSVEDFEGLAEIDGHPGSSVRALAFVPGADLLASGGEDGSVCLWDLTSRELLRSIRGYPTGIRGVAWSTGGDAFAAACEDGDVHLWDARGSATAPWRSLKGHAKAVEAVVFDPRRERLVSAGDDGTVRIWALAGDGSTQLVGHRDWVWCAAFDAGSETLATGGRDRQILIWDAIDGRLLKELTGHADEVHSLTFLEDKGLLASGSDDNTIRLWRIDEGTAWKTVGGHRDCVRSVSYNSVIGLLASASDDETVRLWTSEGEAVRTMRGHRRRVRCVVFAPDGKHLYSAGDDAVIRKWGIDGKCLAEFPGHTASVWSLALDLTGNKLLSGAADGFVRILDMQSGEGTAHWPTRRYERMSIVGSAGLTLAEQKSLERLGATLAVTSPAPGRKEDKGKTLPPGPPPADGTGDPGSAGSSAADPCEHSGGQATDENERPVPTEPLPTRAGLDPVKFLAHHFPEGPAERDIWVQAGGDPSRLSIKGDGHAQWFSALKKLRLGGGGVGITPQSLFDAVEKEYPNSSKLQDLLQALQALKGD